jgi:hypothetical protein
MVSWPLLLLSMLLTPRTTLAGDPDYTHMRGSYCVGCHPGPPLWAGHEPDSNACQARCNALRCACYDYDATKGSAQKGTCRITNSTQQTKRSHAGYDAYIRDGWMPAPYVPPRTASLNVSFAAGGGTPLQNFWHSCGWCPPDPHPLFPSFFAQEDVQQNHLLIGSVPHQGIKYVRIHYLFDLIKLLPKKMAGARTIDSPSTFYFGSASDTSSYLANVGLNFTALDKAMDQLYDADLFPGFEIMGNPGNAPEREDRLFTDFSDPQQILAWKDLVHAVASRYINRYGAPVVRPQSTVVVPAPDAAPPEYIICARACVQVRQWRWESWK